MKNLSMLAIIGALIVLGVLGLIALAVIKNKVDFDIIFPTIASWVSAIIAAIFTLHGRNNGKKKD